MVTILLVIIISELLVFEFVVKLPLKNESSYERSVQYRLLRKLPRQAQRVLRLRTITNVTVIILYCYGRYLFRTNFEIISKSKFLGRQ